jgi:gliding motility-associated-like protein
MNKNCFGKMQHYLLIILFSFSSILAMGQSNFDTANWRFSNPKQFGFTVLDQDFFDNNNVIAVGSDGGIARSTDGGTNWKYGAFTFVNPVNGFITKGIFADVHFITSTVAYAVGSNGLMIKTTDAGISWSQVITPLTSNARNINACWFLDANKGYIGGQWNTADSLTKLYFTLNGGSTWDSIASPAVNGVTRCGYINNVNIPSVLLPVDAKAKEIYRIEFLPNGIGYICGQGSPLFPRVSVNAVAATCLPSTGNLTTGAHTAALLWKLEQGVLTDYSISKERIGYTGINTNTVTCTTGFGNLTPAAQTYRAMNIINDSTVVMMSFNNNTVVRVHTGLNDRTANVNNGGALEKGKYVMLNFPFPPTGGPNAGPPIPPVQVLLASNPYQLRRTSNGTLIANGNSARMFTSVDTGRNWIQSRSLPPGQNYSSNGVWALDIAPNGKFLSMGTNGVVADSIPGGPGWNSNYLTVPLSAAFTKIEFADCNNGVATGSANINVTNDGGKTWWDRTRLDFVNSFYSINGFAYRNSNPARAYFAVSDGTIYHSPNLNVAPPAIPTLDPVYADGLMQMNDVATAGNDSVWAVGYSSFSVPAASRTSKIYRSTNAGTTWAVYSGFPVGTLGPNITEIEFPTRLIGYAAGNRDTVYKTTDGGATWNKLPLPTPGVTPQLTYRDMFALDANTVFLVGNGFPRRFVYRTTDGGATWQDISGNIIAQGAGNFNGVLFHDANNGYVMTPGLMFKTTNGGATWTLEAPPTNCLFETAAFAPKTVPAAVPFANRKLFVSGANISGAPIMEYGKLADINVNSTENITSSCDNAAQGTITINATGGIAPYTYSINGGAFQSSNTFTGQTIGPKTITIKDAYCGVISKTVTVPTRVAPTVNAGPDFTIVEGDNVTLQGSSTSNLSTIAWTPTSSVISGGNTFTPVVKPPVTTNYTMTVTDVNQCISTDVAGVTVIPYCIKAMNAFTPNGDGMNDRWLVTTSAVCTKQIAVAVFNRYGNIVYKNDNYQNNWDGTYNGKPVPDGTYYFTANYTTITNNTILLKGDLTILR